MPLSLEQKKNLVKEVADVVANADTLLTADFRGLTAVKPRKSAVKRVSAFATTSATSFTKFFFCSKLNGIVNLYSQLTISLP